MIHCEDGGPWTHGTVVGRGDHKHNNRSYMICITKTGQIVTRNSKHVKATPITAEQYLLDQLSKSNVDIMDDILKHFEKYTQQNVTHMYKIRE